MRGVKCGMKCGVNDGVKCSVKCVAGAEEVCRPLAAAAAAG